MMNKYACISEFTVRSLPRSMTRVYPIELYGSNGNLKAKTLTRDKRYQSNRFINDNSSFQ